MNIDSLFTKSAKRRAIATSALDVFESLKAYLPLTVRQVYYQLVSIGVVDNRINEYRLVSTVLSKMRVEGIFPYSYIADRSRRTTDKRGISNMQEFVIQQVKPLFEPYHYQRCKVQEQNYYIEVSTEKDALSTVIEEAVWPYCTRLNVIKGQSSTTMVEKMAQRFKYAVNNNQQPVLVHVGDFDPSGWTIPLSIKERLFNDHGVDIHLEVAALNQYQINQYKLPQSMEAAKKTDPNYKKWINKFGVNAKPVEVDALHPKDLQYVVAQAIEGYLDMESFKAQNEIETLERNELKLMRINTLEYLNNQYPTLGLNQHL